jgi:ribonuclease HI
MKEGAISIHTDGGARGNPGPSACAFVAEMDEKLIFKSSKFLGINTNNFAEYSAFLLALQWLSKNNDKFGNKQIIIYSDSELVVRQLSGIYKVKNEKLKALNQKIIGLIKTNNLKISYKSILRSKNKIADQLVNEKLDINV